MENHEPSTPATPRKASFWRLLAGLAGLVALTAQARAQDAPTVGGAWVSEGPGPSRNGQVEGTVTIPNKDITGAISAIANAARS